MRLRLASHERNMSKRECAARCQKTLHKTYEFRRWWLAICQAYLILWRTISGGVRLRTSPRQTFMDAPNIYIYVL